MKVDSKIVQSDPGVTQDLLFQDKAIHKLRIKKGSRKDFKFKDIGYLKFDLHDHTFRIVYKYFVCFNIFVYRIKNSFSIFSVKHLFFFIFLH